MATMLAATSRAAERSTTPDAADKMKPGKSTRLSINIPPALLEELRELAEEECTTITEVVRRAITAERFLREQVTLGNQLLIQEKGQKAPSRVVVFR